MVWYLVTLRAAQSQGRINLTLYFIYWQGDERATAGHFGHDSHKFWIHGAEIRVVSVPGDRYIVETILSFGRTAVNVSKFRATNSAKPELEIKSTSIRHL